MIKYQRPLPNVKEAKSAIEKMLASCQECDFYHRYTPQMVTTNEFYQIREIEEYITSGAKVLTVCGSGEQPMFFKMYGAGDVVSFDISYNSYLLTSLKIAALQSFDKTEDYRQFINVLYNNPNDLLTNPTIHNVVKKLNKVERNYISEAIDVVPIFWSAQSCYFYTIPQNYYDKSRQLIKKPFPFIWTDITELCDKLFIPNKTPENDNRILFQIPSVKTGKYAKFDIIYYSNILEFMQPYHIGKVLKDTINIIKPNGKLFLTVRNISDNIELMTDSINYIYDSSEWDKKTLPEKQGFLQIIIQRKQR